MTSAHNIERTLIFYQVVKGEMTDLVALSSAVSKCRLVISLLGPNELFGLHNDTVFADYYRALFSLMRQHGLRRIFIMGTISIRLPTDSFSLLRTLAVLFIRLLSNRVYLNIKAIQALLEGNATGTAATDAELTRDIDWTVFRIAGIPGGCDAASWEKDRLAGETYVGPMAAKGWTMMQKRAALTRWLVDAANSGAPDLIGKMPTVTRLAGSKQKAD
jgi:hypothetical protein